MLNFTLFLENKDTLNQIIDIVKTFDNKTPLLFRGSYKELDSYGKIAVRKDRKPTSTDVETQEELDFFFKEKFGVKLRSESLFATLDVDMAETYGNLIIVVPKESTNYYTNPHIKDLFYAFDTVDSLLTSKLLLSDELPDILRKLSSITHKAYTPDTLDEIPIKELIKNLKREDYSFIFKRAIDGYKKVTAISDIKTNNEVMVDCDEYYYVRYTREMKMRNYGDLLTTLEKL
jgi:hypothetical protein